MKLTNLFINGFTIASLIAVTNANADKVIFTGPEVATIPLAKPSLSDLYLDVLSPDNWSLRTNLTRKFPQKWHDSSTGHASWFILDHLTASQRYELRVCWSSSVRLPIQLTLCKYSLTARVKEPTSFALDVFELDEVFQTPDLLVSLAEFSQSRQPTEGVDGQPSRRRSAESGERQASLLLLRILAAADYFTDKKALMQIPPPVLADIHLDPYLLNVFPRSLVPTAGFIVVVAALSFVLARYAGKQLQHVALDDDNKKKQ